jgi:hypothetical protein
MIQLISLAQLRSQGIDLASLNVPIKKKKGMRMNQTDYLKGERASFECIHMNMAPATGKADAISAKMALTPIRKHEVARVPTVISTGPRS